MRFDYSSSNDQGAISHIVSHHKNIPLYLRNQNISNSYSYNPRKCFSDTSYSNSFDTYLDQKPFNIMDLYPYFLNPTSYMFSVIKGGSPPVIWELSCSNDTDNWMVLSNPPQNNSLCPNDLDPSMVRVCGETRFVHYYVKDTQEKYRFFKFTVLRDRAKEYNSKSNIDLFRIGFIDIFGILYKERLFSNQYSSCNIINIMIFLMQVILF